MVFRSRVRRWTQTIDALRHHLAEYGLVVPLGTHSVGRLEDAFAGCEEHFPVTGLPRHPPRGTLGMRGANGCIRASDIRPQSFRLR